MRLLVAAKVYDDDGEEVLSVVDWAEPEGDLPADGAFPSALLEAKIQAICEDAVKDLIVVLLPLVKPAA